MSEDEVLEDEVLEDEALEEDQETGEPDAEPEEEESWVNDDLIAEARTYGLNEKDLQEFGDADEFHRAGRLLDMQATRLQSQPTEEPKEEKEEEWKPPYDIDKIKDTGEMDDESVGLFENVNRLSKENHEYRAERDQERALREEREVSQRNEAFHAILDEYKPEFYGKTRGEDGSYQEISSGENDRRQKVHDAVESLLAVQPQLMNSLTPRGLVDRADRLAFDGKREERLESAKKQSKARRSTGRSTGNTSAAKKGTPEAIANSPEVLAFWRKTQRENGEI